VRDCSPQQNRNGDRTSGDDQSSTPRRNWGKRSRHTDVSFMPVQIPYPSGIFCNGQSAGLLSILAASHLNSISTRYAGHYID
jgi:hypothetical protein